MIIECPACVTRYDIKAEMPPEGRTVRCAKCGTLWRAMPESIGETAAEAQIAPPKTTATVNDEAAVEQAIRHFAAEGHAAGGEDHSEEEYSDALSGDSEWSEAAHAHDDDWSMHADGSFAAPGETEEAEEAYSQDEPSELDAEPETAAGLAEEESQLEDSGKVRWFDAFRRKKKASADEVAENSASSQHAPAAAETIPFPRAIFSGKPDAHEGEELRTLEEARQAVRSVFSNLRDGRSSSDAGAYPSAAAALAAEKESDASPHARGVASLESDWTGPEEDSGNLASARDLPNWPDGVADTADRDESLSEASGWRGANGQANPDAAQAAEESDDAAASLRDAMRAHFASSPIRTPFFSQPQSEELARKPETHPPAAPAFSERAAPVDAAGLWGKSPRLAGEEMTEREPEPVSDEEPADSRNDDGSFDQRLFREIEEAQEKSGAVKSRKAWGGLALAAAWGFFLCVAAGLVVGFLAFRDTIANSQPGLAPLYRSLGMPVTLQHLVFQSVQYEWKISDNKPVLAVSGSVYNQANRKVVVPQFFITVKDKDPSLDREYSANLRIRKSRLRANQSADFDIELMSPSPTLTSVELELRHVR